jgi:hypothetical protein
VKTTILVLSAAGLLSAAGASDAAPRQIQPYLDQASAAATARLESHGVTPAEAFRVKARIGADGRVNTVALAGSGSLETDAKAREALRGLKVAKPPAELAGREVSLVVGPAPLLQARAR